ncbi:MAG: hypothetical protein IIB05_09465 [Bacteroidetes bacterium]|nr:hypothetical protein [Bacteroidota bacterium]
MKKSEHMRFLNAIVRKPGINYSEGITTAGLGKPDIKLALRQYEAYCRSLEKCGLFVEKLEPAHSFPDAVFVEDTAIVTGNIAVIARPGDLRRRGEENIVEKVIKKYRTVVRIEEPGTLDGGDICQTEDRFFIGISGRTNHEGAMQLKSILSHYGYSASLIEVHHTLHLKSGFNNLGNNRLLIHEQFYDNPAIKKYEKIIVPEKEAYAANVVRVNDHLLVPEGFPETLAKLKQLNIPLIILDVSEFRKMDGGLSCLSIRF